MNHNLYAWITVAVIALVTAAIRFLPFLAFRGGRRIPRWIEKLGKALPAAMMGMLVVFCLKGISLSAAPYGLPEFLACVAVAALHVWKRNTLLSIAGGTVLYMVLVQMVF